jgi:hypothetical protein
MQNKKSIRSIRSTKSFPLFLLLLCAMLSAPCVYSADAVQPQTLSNLKLYRDVTSINYSTNVHYTQGATLLMTNMQCYSSADLGVSSTVQGLSTVTVEVATSTSSSTTGTWINATVLLATNGTYCVTIPSLPAYSTVYWQCRLTDVNTNIFYYQTQMLYADPHL